MPSDISFRLRRSVLDAGGFIVAGSDFPVEETAPINGLYAAVTRRDHQGSPAAGWYPAKRLTLDEAIVAFTAGPALAGFVEEHRGRVIAGMVADLTVFDRALVEGRELLDTRIDLTVVGGEVVYERGAR